jgi:hypothetical protein
MKNYCLRLKTIIATLIVCGGFVSATAQIQRNAWINFYGKVVDQNNQPVTGAVVKLVIAADPSEDNVPEEKEYTTETSGDGKFSLIGAVGRAMQILSVAKPGYDLSKKAKLGYAYLLSSDIHHPDAKAPVIFKMWKSVGKERLVHTAWHGKVVCDGITHRYDLSTGVPSTNGVLEITCSRVPINLPPANVKPFSYNLQIAMADGGIQATDDEFTYLAPSDGYLPSFSVGQIANDRKWDRNTPLPKEYYIKTTDGHFGRLRVEWDLAGQSPTRINWDCFINPSGSRNLER